MRVLEPFFNGYDSNYSELRTRCRDILQQEDSLSEIVQLVGRDSLSEDQKVINNGSAYDRKKWKCWSRPLYGSDLRRKKVAKVQTHSNICYPWRVRQSTS